MPLSKPVITTGPVMSRLCLLCFLFIFSSPSLFIQLSGSGPKRSKREAVGDHSAQPFTETQKSITLLSPRKETYMLVSEREAVGLIAVHRSFGITHLRRPAEASYPPGNVQL